MLEIADEPARSTPSITDHEAKASIDLMRNQSVDY
jgi:hypothetical protein